MRTRYDYMFSRRYSPTLSLTKYDEEQSQMSGAKDRRKKAERSGFVKLIVTLVILFTATQGLLHLENQDRVAHHKQPLTWIE